MEKEGFISSPNYGAFYDHNLDCIWIIDGSKYSTSKISLNFLDFHLFDGQVERSKRSIASLLRHGPRNTLEIPCTSDYLIVSIHFDQENMQTN